MKTIALLSERNPKVLKISLEKHYSARVTGGGCRAWSNGARLKALDLRSVPGRDPVPKGFEGSNPSLRTFFYGFATAMVE